MPSNDAETATIANDKRSVEEETKRDVFEEHPDHDFHYKTLSWQFVTFFMISEVVSNGILSLPSSLAAVGIVPALVLIIFLGIFALYTSKLLIDFKLNHPNVHNMGDAGNIIGGPIAKEIMAAGTVIFAISGTGSQVLVGQMALSTLSQNSLCNMYFALIFSAAIFFLSLPRTLERVSWLNVVSVVSITACGVFAMIGAGLNPVPGRVLSVTVPTNFYQAFLAITNPVFSYAGHFIFFILISEMKRPEDAMKAACFLQGFATIFYAVFAVVVAGGLYSHTAAKLVFVRIFRHSNHIYNHTLLGWGVWIVLCFSAAVIAFIFAISVPIFAYLIAVSASLFASWYTYGVAGFLWLYDVRHLEGGGSRAAWLKRPFGFVLAVLTIFAGAFMCVAGTYVSIKLIDDAYKTGSVGKPFSC